MKTKILVAMLLAAAGVSLMSFVKNRKVRHDDAKLKECWVGFETYDG